MFDLALVCWRLAVSQSCDDESCATVSNGSGDYDVYGKEKTCVYCVAGSARGTR